jgi:hypothetical protein
MVFYILRHNGWVTLRGVENKPEFNFPRGCAHTQWRAKLWRAKAFKARKAYHEWLDSQYVLKDFKVYDGSRAWFKAIEEAQRPYPGTEAWLKSCSASEGGWGRWVPNSQGSGVGGWLQFMPGTWSGFYRHAVADVAARGYIVPASANSWYSPLGQALAGAWGITHGMRHHWVGGGCHIN